MDYIPWDHMHGLDLHDEIDELANSTKFGEDLPSYVQQPPPPQQQQQQEEVVVQQGSLQQLLPTQQQPLVQHQGHTQQVFFSTITTEPSNDSIIHDNNCTGLKLENHDVSPAETPHEGGQNTAEFAAIMNSAASTGQTAFTPGQAQTLVMPGGKHVMLLPNQAMGPNQYFLAAPTTIGTQQVMQQQQQHSSGSIDLPAHNDWAGEYDFQVKIEEKERTVKSPMWMMSSIMQKLYTNINKPVPFEVRMHRRPPGVNYNVRATLIFSEQQYMRMNVIRCPNHAAPSDPSNHDFPYAEHVVRCDHPGAKYESHPSGRLSVCVPLDNLQDGMEFTPILLRFMCLGSCVGGINRKYISLILGLEDMSGRTVGRRVIHVRVCACPTRDIKTDELQYQNKGIKRKGSTGLVEKKVLAKKTKTKEPKLEPADDDDDDQIYYLPVRGRKLYNYLQDMMLVFSRHFPDHARNSSVEVPADDSAQQKPHRTVELKEFGSKNTIYRPKILKSTNPVSEGSLEQCPNVIVQNSSVHKTISEKYSDEVFQHFLNQEVLKRNNIEVDNGTIKTKSVISSHSTKKIPQQKHIFLKNPAVENVGAKIQLVKKDEKKLITFPKFRKEKQTTSKNLDIVELSGQISNAKLEHGSTGRETLIHMPEALEERQGTSKYFDVGVLTRHIPVVPITHFIPRTKLIKAKSNPINRVNMSSENMPTISRATTISDISSSLGKNTSEDPEEVTYSISDNIQTISRSSSLSNIRVSSGKNTLGDTEKSTYSISQSMPTISRVSDLSNTRVISGKNTYKGTEDTYSTSVDIIPHFPSTSLRPAIVQSLSPDSPEMMAANVLISDLKYSLHKEIKKPPNRSGE